MSALLKGLDVDENKSHGEDQYIVYVDGKPGMKYDNSFEAREVVKMLQAKYPQKKFTIERTVCKSERIAEKMKMGADSDASSAGSFKMGEDFAPPAQLAQTTTDAPPRRAFSIALQGKPGKDFAARYAWDALQKVFPNDYPVGSEAAEHKVVEVSKKGSAIVKTGLTSQDIAESLVAKLIKFRVPAQCWRIVGGELEEAANPAQQAAIAIAMKKKGQKPKNEAQGDTLMDPDIALPQARRITKAIKYDDTATDIIVQLQMLAERTEGVDQKTLEYSIDEVYAAKKNLESAVYGLEEAFEDAVRNAQYKRDEEDLNEGPSIFSNSNGGQSYRKFKPKSAGTFNEDNLSETPTDNPTGASGEGGWRTYKAKSAGTFPKKESAIFKGLRESYKG